MKKGRAADEDDEDDEEEDEGFEEHQSLNKDMRMKAIHTPSCSFLNNLRLRYVTSTYVSSCSLPRIRAYLTRAVLLYALYLTTHHFFLDTTSLRVLMNEVTFLAHVPIQVSEVVPYQSHQSRPFMPDTNTIHRRSKRPQKRIARNKRSTSTADDIPLYILSASEDRWRAFVAPRGVIPIRVENAKITKSTNDTNNDTKSTKSTNNTNNAKSTNSTNSTKNTNDDDDDDSIFKAYFTHFFDATSDSSIYTDIGDDGDNGDNGNGNGDKRRFRERQARCAVGHMFIWDLIAEDPRCVHGCMVSEDDATFPHRVDPRPYISTWLSALGPHFDYVSLFSDIWTPPLPFAWAELIRKRTALLAFFGYAREELMYVNYGYGTVAYVLTSEGARKLMAPFHAEDAEQAPYRLETTIDDYIYFRRSHYRHEASTYVEFRYPITHDGAKGASLIHTAPNYER